MCTFLSTLSLRRATKDTTARQQIADISIHALLAESDHCREGKHGSYYRFLSTLSLRRATPAPVPRRPHAHISIHALLAESDGRGPNTPLIRQISIHALLAESDSVFCRSAAMSFYFYPRSPCGERRNAARHSPDCRLFLSTLSLRRATTIDTASKNRYLHFYPRSPCGERPALSGGTLSDVDFYPRSPCGERPYPSQCRTLARDFYPRSPCGERPILCTSVKNMNNFYPRSPCGERQTSARRWAAWCCLFLSTLSLRRAT